MLKEIFKKRKAGKLYKIEEGTRIRMKNLVT